MQSPCPSILLHKLRNQTFRFHRGSEAENRHKPWSHTLSAAGTLCAIPLGTLFGARNTLAGGPHCFKQRSLLRAGCVCMAASGCSPIHRPTASPADVTPWELLPLPGVPKQGSLRLKDSLCSPLSLQVPLPLPRPSGLGHTPPLRAVLKVACPCCYGEFDKPCLPWEFSVTLSKLTLIPVSCSGCGEVSSKLLDRRCSPHFPRMTPIPPTLYTRRMSLNRRRGGRHPQLTHNPVSMCWDSG